MISSKECLSHTKQNSTHFRKTTWNSTMISKSSKVLQIIQNSKKSITNKLSSFHRNSKKKKSRDKNSENFLTKLSFRRTSSSTKFIHHRSKMLMWKQKPRKSSYSFQRSFNTKWRTLKKKKSLSSRTQPKTSRKTSKSINSFWKNLKSSRKRVLWGKVACDCH